MKINIAEINFVKVVIGVYTFIYLQPPKKVLENNYSKNAENILENGKGKQKLWVKNQLFFFSFCLFFFHWQMFIPYGFPPPKFKLFQFNIRRKMQHYLLQYFFVTLLWFLKVLINKTIIFAFYFDWYLPFFMYKNDGETDIYRLFKYLILHLKILMSNKLTKKLECTIAVWCNRTIRILRGDCLNFDYFFWSLISKIQ